GLPDRAADAHARARRTVRDCGAGRRVPALQGQGLPQRRPAPAGVAGDSESGGRTRRGCPTPGAGPIPPPGPACASGSGGPSGTISGCGVFPAALVGGALVEALGVGGMPASGVLVRGTSAFMAAVQYASHRSDNLTGSVDASGYPG